MIHLLQSIGAHFSKIAVITGLTKLKIFYQILVIIAIMILFLGIQAYMSEKTANTMQNATQSLLDEGFTRLNQLSKIRMAASDLSSNYTDSLLDPDAVSSATNYNHFKNNVNGHPPGSS